MARPANANVNGKKFATQQSVNQAVKAICDIMRRSNCAGALQYVPELTWILFLRILDEREEIEAGEARVSRVKDLGDLVPQIGVDLRGASRAAGAAPATHAA